MRNTEIVARKRERIRLIQAISVRGCEDIIEAGISNGESPGAVAVKMLTRINARDAKIKAMATRIAHHGGQYRAFCR